MEKELITAHIFNPCRTLFKQAANSRAECQTVQCCGFNDCGLYARGECCWLAIFDHTKCPYGEYHVEVGPTKRAGNFSTWILERQKKYENVLNKLQLASNVLAIVGDFIYIPYAHMTANETVPSRLLPKEHFTLETIISICNFRPRAIWTGQEITSYQKEEIPKFVKHLSEMFPKLYNQLCEALPRIKELSLSNVGRQAYLLTLSPNVGKFIDCHKAEWVWDGSYLTSKNSRASFMLVNKFSELRIKPEGNPTVTITDEKQVNDKTKFYQS